MKLKLFLILLFISSIIVEAFYFTGFLHDHPSIGRAVTVQFVLLLSLSILLQMCGNLLRAYKSRFLLDQIRTSKTSLLFKGLSVGYLFNALLPFRLGELIRAYYVGDALSVSKTAVFLSIVIERIVDGGILGLCFITAGSLAYVDFPQAGLLITRFGAVILSTALVLVAIVHLLHSENKYVLRAISIVSAMFNPAIADRLRFMAWSGIYGTRLMLGSRAILAKYYATSVVMWLFYFASTVCAVWSFFMFVSPATIWFVVQSVYAGVSVPAGPGYIGTFHTIVADLTTKLGLDSAVSFSLLMWLIIIGPTSLVGLFVLIRQRFGEKHESNQQEALINKLYRDKDVSAELGHFLDAYFKGEVINHVLTGAELDGKFRLIKSFKGGSNAHTMLVWQDQELRVKKITLIQFADKLQDQADWLLSREKLDHLPKVVAEDKTAQYYSFDLAYKEDFFPFFDFIHSRATAQSFKVMEKVLLFMNKRIYKPVPADDGRANLENYIETKVLGKVNDSAALSSDINQLLTYSKIKINGVNYDNLLQVVEKIKRHKKAMAELADYPATPIHGDLTVDNLIVSGEGDFVVIDPNNENQVPAPVVDYGKLYQSLHSGYEFLIQLERCQLKDNVLHFEESKSHKYAEIFHLLDHKLERELEPKDYRSILFHEAVHYCRMLTYKVSINPRTAPVFYATAVKLFNDYLKQYE